MSGRWVALSLIVILAASLTAAWFVTRPDHRLYEWGWELESATFEGDLVDIETNGVPVRWRFTRTCDSGTASGPGCADLTSLQTTGGCGWIVTSVVHDGPRVRWTGDAREIAPSCVGEVTKAVIAIGGAGWFDVGFGGDRLVVSGSDDSSELVFRPYTRISWGEKGD